MFALGRCRAGKQTNSNACVIYKCCAQAAEWQAWQLHIEQRGWQVLTEIQPNRGSVMTSKERASAVKNERNARLAPMLTAQQHKLIADLYWTPALCGVHGAMVWHRHIYRQ